MQLLVVSYLLCDFWTGICLPVLITAEKAEHPPKPVRKAKKHRSQTASDPWPLTYATHVRLKRRTSHQRPTLIDGIIAYPKRHSAQQRRDSRATSISQ